MDLRTIEIELRVLLSRCIFVTASWRIVFNGFENIIYSITKNITSENVSDYLSVIIGNTRNDLDFMREFETASIKVQKQTYHISARSRNSCAMILTQRLNRRRKSMLSILYPRSPEEGHIWRDHDDGYIASGIRLCCWDRQFPGLKQIIPK